MAEAAGGGSSRCRRSVTSSMRHGSGSGIPPRDNRWRCGPSCRRICERLSPAREGPMCRSPVPTRWSTLASSQTTILEQLAAARTLLFRVAGSVYGCDIDAVREIIPYRRATRLPGAPPYVQGLINLRGTIVTVLDLGARLEPGRPPVHEGSIIMVEHGNRTVGLAVEEVMDVRVIEEEEGAVLPEQADAIVRGVGHADATVVVLLEVYTLIKQALLS